MVRQEQLIYSQWACGGKDLSGEGFASVLGREKPVLNLFRLFG